MIYTVTLNPSLDRVIWVDHLAWDDSLRIQNEEHYAGGKGIDASRVVRTLGGPTTASGFLGSFNGLHLEGLLINEGVMCDFVKIASETRSNVIIFDKESEGKHISLNSRGPSITPYDLASLFNKVTNLNVKPSFVILGGSLPSGVNQNIYAQLIHTFRQQGIRVALDADNEPLKFGIEERPYLIKPNSHEFARLVGFLPNNNAEFIKAGQSILQQGVEIILVTRGADGLLVFNSNEAHYVKAPKIEVKSTIGSGDSTLAAFMLGLEQGRDLAECGRMGAAAGAATAMSPGVELVSLHDYNELLEQVSSQKIDLVNI